MAEVPPSDGPVDAASVDEGGLHATMDAAITMAAKKGRRLSATFAARADEMATARLMLAKSSAAAATKGEAHTAQAEARAADAAHHGSDAKALATAAAFGGAAHAAAATTLSIGRRVKTFAGEGVAVSENAGEMWAVKLDWKLAQGQKAWGVFHSSALTVVTKKRKKKMVRIPSMNRRTSTGPAPGPPPKRAAAPVAAPGSDAGDAGSAASAAADGASAAKKESAKPGRTVLVKRNSAADILGTLLLKKKRRVRRMSALGEGGHHRDMEGVLEKLATPLGVINLFPRWQERFFKVQGHYLMYKGVDDEWLGGVDIQGDDADIVLAKDILTVRGLSADMHDGATRKVRVLRVR